MGQRSLMPGQCPGLPGFGYATGVYAGGPCGVFVGLC